jgi:hypothetical protein
MENHKISENVARWKLDLSQLSAEDIEVLNIVNFPRELGYRQAAQKRIKRMRANNGFIDKQVTDINDIKYTVTSKNVAKFDVQRHTPTGRTPDQVKRAAEFIEGVLKTKPNKFVYIDANYIQSEMLDILTLYSKPKPTPNMESKQEIKKENNKPAKKKKAKRILTDEEIKLATEKLTTGEMDLKEVAALLGVTQTLLKPLLKTLKNGKK